MTTWQDISTAPKDGTRVDLWDGSERISDGYWNDDPEYGADKPTWWGPNLWYDGMPGPLDEPPTHWMYPPAPPTV